MRAAVGLGGGPDTVAAVTGGPAGAVPGAGALHGTCAVPARWTEAPRVPPPGRGGRELRPAEPTAPARRPAAVTAP
ncbi:hypothetical protein [Streptomyces sp. NRRL S-340]|uniref:hypothetical protein n=1 Tax=Streptomyces sp. NRRL S-340 TaxID=1463901 RepID=UPI00131B83CE